MGANNTQRIMIYTDLQTERMLTVLDQSVTFDELLAEIRQLNIRIRELPYQK